MTKNEFLTHLNATLPEDESYGVDYVVLTCNKDKVSRYICADAYSLFVMYGCLTSVVANCE